VEGRHLDRPIPSTERWLLECGATLGGFATVVAHQHGNRIADYDTVFAYFPPGVPLPSWPPDSGPTRVLVLAGDRLLPRYGPTVPLAQAYTDLFQLPGWPAARFVEVRSRGMVRDAAV